MSEKAYCESPTRSGTPCHNYAGFKTGHLGIGRCYLHGGSTRNHVKSANVEKARRAVADLALPVDIHPHVALMRLMAYRWGEVEFWNDVITDMESMQDLKQRDMNERFEKPSVWYEMRDRALTAAERIAKTCHDVGIEERRQRVAEEHGHEVATMLRNVTSEMILALTDEGIPAEVSLRLQSDVIPRIVQAQLRQLIAGGDVPGAAATTPSGIHATSRHFPLHSGE